MSKTSSNLHLRPPLKLSHSPVIGFWWWLNLGVWPLWVTELDLLTVFVVADNYYGLTAETSQISFLFKMWKYYQPVTADDHTPACANWASSHRMITFFWLQRSRLKANNILLWCTYLILILGDAVSDSFFTLMPPLSVPLPARRCCVWHVMAICRLAVVKLMTPFFKPQRDDDIFLHDVLQREAVRHFNSPTDPLAAMATVSRSTWTMPALTRGVFLLLVSRWFRTCWITWCECWAWKSQRGFQVMFGTNIEFAADHMVNVTDRLYINDGAASEAPSYRLERTVFLDQTWRAAGNDTLTPRWKVSISR